MTAEVKDKLLTPPEAARLLGLAVHTLSVWRCTGRVALPYTKIGRSVRYRQSDIEAVLASNTTGGTKKVATEKAEKPTKWED